MSQVVTWQVWLARLAHWLAGLRYLKFGLVGASGTVVNMAILYLGQEYLFSAIATQRERLYASLALAIAVATVNNFTWNRLWTWADRQTLTISNGPRTSLGWQFGRYALASWLGIGVQYMLTLWLAHSMHYMLANVTAIVVASVSNFLANDRWTFRRRKPQ